MINVLLKKQFIKFVLGSCRHFCCLCQFKNQCDDNWDEPMWKELIIRWLLNS